jgi:hypothetical protein
MKNHNKNGVPLWAIKRALICRVNLQTDYQSFAIDAAGNIFLDDQYASHLDHIRWDSSKKHFYIPLKQAV